MLYIYPRLRNHIAFRLNRNITYFFCKIRRANASSTITPWNTFFSEDFAQFLRSGKQKKLRDLFTTFFEAFKVLPQNEKDDVIVKFTETQKVDKLLTDISVNCSAYHIDTLPITLQNPAKNLFEYLYQTTLNSYGKLRNHYKDLFQMLDSNICPFCGIELLNSPSIVRQDYDHMMKQSSYVFGTVNMNNLVPAGTECNRINKHSIDALYHNSARSVFNSPYINHYDIQITLTGSTPPATIDGAGNWVINITPVNDYTRQWDHVYNITARYSDNVLQKFYKNWLKELRTFFRESDLIPIDEPNLIAELQIQSNTLLGNPLTGIGNIVKGAFFAFLIQYDNCVYRASLISYMNN